MGNAHAAEPLSAHNYGTARPTHFFARLDQSARCPLVVSGMQHRFEQHCTDMLLQ